MNPFGDSEVPPRVGMIKRLERTRKRTRRIVVAALAAGSAAIVTLLSYQYGFWGRANRQIDHTAPAGTVPFASAKEGPPERERPTPELLPLAGGTVTVLGSFWITDTSSSSTANAVVSRQESCSTFATTRLKQITSAKLSRRSQEI